MLPNAVLPEVVSVAHLSALPLRVLVDAYEAHKRRKHAHMKPPMSHYITQGINEPCRCILVFPFCLFNDYFTIVSRRPYHLLHGLLLEMPMKYTNDENTTMKLTLTQRLQQHLPLLHSGAGFSSVHPGILFPLQHSSDLSPHLNAREPRKQRKHFREALLAF